MKLASNRQLNSIKQQVDDYMAGAKRLYAWNMAKYVGAEFDDGKTERKKRDKKQYLELMINYPISPKWFRDSYLKIPKSTISRWKTGSQEQQAMWNYIQDGVQELVAMLEVQLLHTSDPAKARSLIHVLQSWDAHRYNDKLIAAKQLRLLQSQGQLDAPPMLIKFSNTGQNKIDIFKEK